MMMSFWNCTEYTFFYVYRSLVLLGASLWLIALTAAERGGLGFQTGSIVNLPGGAPPLKGAPIHEQTTYPQP